MCSCAALLAHGDGLRQRLPGCLRHGLDGKELGRGSDGSGSAGREVHKHTLSLRNIYVCLHIYIIQYHLDTVWISTTTLKLYKQHHVSLSFYREGIYRLLPQTTPENIAKNFDQYTIDPGTRYPNLNFSCVRPHQVRWSTHFYNIRVFHLSIHIW